MASCGDHRAVNKQKYFWLWFEGNNQGVKIDSELEEVEVTSLVSKEREPNL